MIVNYKILRNLCNSISKEFSYETNNLSRAGGYFNKILGRNHEANNIKRP